MMQDFDARFMSPPAGAALGEMRDMVDGVISVLVVADGKKPNGVLGLAPAGSLSGPGPISGSEGRSLRAVPGLDWRHVQGPEEAAAELRRRPVDAILLAKPDLDVLGWLQTFAGNLPVLVLLDDSALDPATRIIAAGAEDVLLPADLRDAGLRRRICLAIGRKACEHQRLRQAREDRLTGLANGTLLEERFIRALARSDRFATLVGLVAIAIDGFDSLLDRYGQRTADHLLATIGQRLVGGTRQTDTLARTRDHGFSWLVEGLSMIDDIKALVDRLPDQLQRPFSIHGQEVRLTASVGVAIAPFHGRDFQTVHGMAEAAMLDVSTISGDALLILPIQPMRSAALT